MRSIRTATRKLWAGGLQRCPLAATPCCCLLLPAAACRPWQDPELAKRLLGSLDIRLLAPAYIADVAMAMIQDAAGQQYKVRGTRFKAVQGARLRGRWTPPLLLLLHVR